MEQTRIVTRRFTPIAVDERAIASRPSPVPPARVAAGRLSATPVAVSYSLEDGAREAHRDASSLAAAGAPVLELVSSSPPARRQVITPATSSELTEPRLHVHLTRREREVLNLLCLRLTDPEIARYLSIGTRTVESHVARILAKLYAANRREAAIVAVRLGLV